MSKVPAEQLLPGPLGRNGRGGAPRQIAQGAALSILRCMNSIDLPAAGADTRVVVAMSGGVDSSVVAALLKAEGYDVVGVTLQLYDQGAAAGRPGACCAGRDIQDARRVAETLGIPHYVLDFERRFRAEVIDDFAASYLAGATPIPCVRCNQRIKFRDLLEVARDLGAQALATGHYARRVPGRRGAELHRPADRKRDQTYFLFATTPAQLDFLRFPLGAMGKDEVRKLAERWGLPVAAKPDSQDICFVPSGRYAEVIERLRPGAAEPGDIVDLAGGVVGRHAGVVHYTIGQRRGLGGGGAEPQYVVALDAARRRVVVGPRAALGVAEVELSEMNWLVEPDGAAPIEAAVKLRSTQPAVPARIHPQAGGGARVELLRAEAGVAPGQAGVIYAGDRVLGGGWIAATRPVEAGAAALGA
jgi:tRNA-specific 2-thiouridylase